MSPAMELFGPGNSLLPFQSLSDLQLGDKKVTLNHLGAVSFGGKFCWILLFGEKKSLGKTTAQK